MYIAALVINQYNYLNGCENILGDLVFMLHICIKQSKPVIWAVLLIFFFSSFSGVLHAERVGLFSRIRQSTEEQANNLRDREWWITRVARTVAGSIGGYAVGAVGAGIGYMIGAGMGGPLLAGTGALLGYRIARLIGRVFVASIAEVVAERRLESGAPINSNNVKDSFKYLDIGSLSFESFGAVIGDFAGAALGAAAGIAFLSGASCIAIPVLGTFSAAFVGAKLGSMIGGAIGRGVTSFTFRKGYEIISERRKNRQENEQPAKAPEEHNLEERNEPETKDPDPEDFLAAAYRQYVNSYNEYLNATNSGADSQTINRKQQAYKAAYNNYLNVLNQFQ